MIEKVVLLICDGLGDRPVEKLDGLTPLEAARTPHLDQLARESECGIMYSLGRGIVPGSDTSHLAILGYDPAEYYFGRGPIEAAGIGLTLQPGDVALRGNFGTVDEQMNIIDRRAGRIKVVKPLTEALDGTEIDGVKFIVKPGTAHRAGVVMRGEGLSSDIIDADPHVKAPVREVKPTRDTPEANRTAAVLNRFLEQAHEILQKHDFNLERSRKEKLPANYLLVRGAGMYGEVPDFKQRYGMSACCIAGGGLYKGIGAFLGMEIKSVAGATGLDDTDIDAKFDAVVRNLSDYDFVFVHVKAADSLGEDGKFLEKKEFIERIDLAAHRFLDLPGSVLLIVTADHSTPCEQSAHSADPVPILFRGSGVRVDDVTTFGERSCARGGLGVLLGKEIMLQVQNLRNRLPLLGA